MEIFQNHHMLDFANIVADMCYVIWIVIAPANFIEFNYSFEATDGALLLANLVAVMSLASRLNLIQCRRQGAHPDLAEAFGWSFFAFHVISFRHLMKTRAMLFLNLGMAAVFMTGYALRIITGRARKPEERRARKTN